MAHRIGSIASGVIFICSFVALAAEKPVGIVSHIKVVSDKVPDVSSLEAWKQSFIKPGMSDQDKALAVWKTVVAFRHQDAPPNEFLQNESNVHDPIKCFNVYGYGMCCCASANIEALARYAGLQARGWAITLHSVPEVFYDGDWHLLDASLITYFTKSDGSLASVKEISEGVAAWNQQHTDIRGNDAKLMKFAQSNGWKTNGPEILSRSPFYDENGWLPAATHGWHSTLTEYGKPARNFAYEYGSAVGYEVNIQLRPGERLTRNWFNKGLHINQNGGDAPGALKGVPGKNDMRYAPKFGDIAPGRVGNGVLEYDVPVKSAALAASAMAYENLTADEKSPALHAKDAAKPATLILRMPTSYIYLSGQASLDAVVGDGGTISVAFSDNNGLDWKEITKITSTGPQQIDLKPLVFRRYDYRLRFTLTGSGTGLNALKLTHDIQHSQRPLPALDKGTNTIAFSAGLQEGTIVIEGSTDPENKGKILFFTDFHPRQEGMSADRIFLAGGKGQIIFPIATPGDITRIRIGAHYRARDKRDGMDVQASFYNGGTWKSIGRLEGPFVGNSKYFVFADVPKGARQALVRFAGQQMNTTGIFDLRISADYVEPAGGFAPVKVTYVWTENGAEKRDIHIARRSDEKWAIKCEGKPVMRSIALELAQ